MVRGKPLPISAAFFFPQQLSLDAPGVNLDVEFLLQEGGQLNEGQRRFGGSLCYQERDHFRRKLVTASGTSL
jgi:hypothetical protein